ncbi:hypothetical protein NDU88_004900 [Pleurodeles waltl]|uniref:Uncharacterized protein n=1 Tax=Pleurodeles waltl TaxID=8319 RepID=A0AAV7UGJ7_PLEWA|nr:hypothetical protein NDU88_004900 [Pleurodeles waltl]
MRQARLHCIAIQGKQTLGCAACIALSRSIEDAFSDAREATLVQAEHMHGPAPDLCCATVGKETVNQRWVQAANGWSSGSEASRRAEAKIEVSGKAADGRIKESGSREARARGGEERTPGEHQGDNRHTLPATFQEEHGCTKYDPS